MRDPIRDLQSHMNRHLCRLDPELEIEAEVSVPVVLSFGPLEHETDLRFRFTEDDVELVDPEAQVRRIEKEVFDRLTDGYPQYEYNGKRPPHPNEHE